MIVDDEKKESLYKIVESKILALLEEDPYDKGFYLPAELELMKRYSVSRHTVRKAMDNLVLRGMITREKGKGTKKNLTVNLVKTTLNSWESLSDEMYSKGHRFSYTNKKVSMEKISSEIKKIFSIDNTPIKELVALQRVGKDEMPGVYFLSYFTPDLKLEIDKDFMKGNFTKLYDYLEKNYDVKVQFSEEEITALMPDEKIKKILDIKNEVTPILCRKRIVYDKNGNVVEYNIGYYRGDHFSYNVKLENKKK